MPAASLQLPSSAVIRPAGPRDLAALLEIEASCFESDRLSERSFRRLLSGESAGTLVECTQRHVRGYALVLYRRGSRTARLYSFAVRRECRGQGIAKRLMTEMLRLAAARGCTRMRLELRRDNVAARRLYERAGFRLFAEAPRFYEDRMDALRLERPLQPGRTTRALPIAGKGKLAA